MDERRGNRRIYAAGECAEDAIGRTDLRLNCRDCVVSESPGRPGCLGACNGADEVLKQALPARGVHNLRVELNPPEVACRICQRGEWRGVRSGERGESRRRLNNGVAVAHPDTFRTSCAESSEERARRRADGDVGGTVLTSIRRPHAPTELLRHQLHAVADAEDWNPRTPEPRIWLWARVVIDRIRTAAQDDAGRLPRQDLRQRSVEREKRGINVHLAHATRDQLRKLAPEIQDENAARLNGRRTRARRCARFSGHVASSSLRSRRLERRSPQRRGMRRASARRVRPLIDAPRPPGSRSHR